MKVIGALVGVIALVAVGVAVGVTVAKNKSNNSSSSSSNSGVVKSDPNDPSIFEKDDRLRQSFYALAYTPENSLFPYCGNSLGTCRAFPPAVRVAQCMRAYCRGRHHRYSGM